MPLSPSSLLELNAIIRNITPTPTAIAKKLKLVKNETKYLVFAVRPSKLNPIRLPIVPFPDAIIDERAMVV